MRAACLEGILAGRRFRLESLTAAGGMGRVYRARDEKTGASAAVKIIQGGGQVTSERFGREVRLLSDLEHPAIVRYLDHGSLDEDQYFLAMEWLDGEDLACRVSRGALSLRETLALATRVAEALAFAHARGVIHRDIKPANLFLGGGAVEQAKVVDFGIARTLGLQPARGTKGADGELSITGVPVGTIGYMAPEQARGERNLDARVDVFALACVLFECLAARPPFWGDHAIAVLAKILIEDPPTLAEAGAPPVPVWLAALVRRMLSNDPRARPADGAALLRELTARAEDLSSLATCQATSPLERPPALVRQNESSLAVAERLAHVQRTHRLSARQAQVLGPIAQGNANKAIAQTLGRAERTVELYVSVLFGRMSAKSRGQLIVRFWTWEAGNEPVRGDNEDVPGDL